MPTQQANNSKQSAKQPAGGRRPPATASAPAPKQNRTASSPSGAAERDETYGLISVLYHALQGAETYSQYIADAERAGKTELVEFFRECQEEENARAKRARSLLADALDEADDEDVEDEDEDKDEDEDEDENEDEED
ncbi:MAG TPA: hypothetical protein VFQ61_00215 [Polyangiaceae bacterium]|nr:hypothetical protein [Polyangiaceae bacterium]